MDAWLESHRTPLVLILLCIVAVGAAVWLQRLGDRRPLVISEITPTAVIGGPQVYVSGAVKNPGVYAIDDGDRTADVIERAGGTAEDADLDAINLATRLKDEQHVHVPRRGEPPLAPSAIAAASGPAALPPHLIDLNAATADELDLLPGIGPATAQKIIQRRTSKGVFRQVEELRTEKLVNSSTYAKIKDLVTVDAAPASVAEATPSATPAPR